MERNQQYALYDGAGGGPQRWVAHVRLTPELLQRLQQQPAAVSIQLQAPGGGGATRANSAKLNSVLTIHDGNGDDSDKYEMLSFAEDAKNNAVCAFRAAEGGGYALHQVGRVFQKLIVQRMLDSTEKGRMKDRHAKSVLESKARASKFVAAEEAGKARTTRASKMIATRGALRIFPPGHPLSQAVPRGGAPAETASSIKKRKLRSALSEEDVQELQERIARGRGSNGNIPEDMEVDTEPTESVLYAQPRSSIFSSDSEAEKSPERVRRVVDTSAQADSKPTVKTDAPAKKAARKATPKAKDKAGTSPAAMAKPTTDELESTAQAKPSPSGADQDAEAKTNEAIEEQPAIASPPTKATTPTSAAPKRKAVDQDATGVSSTAAPLVKLPPVKASKTEPKKRARPRLSRLPDISFLPPNVQEICKRVSAHITRTAILDAADFDSFVAEHDRLRTEWEELDKAYSIETILIDGAHFQLPFATTEEEQQSLRRTIEAAEAKREGLLFVRDSMGTIHKILASLQSSIATYEQKTSTDHAT